MNKSEIGVQWHNASKGIFPVDNQEILISVNGIYYVSLYDLNSNIFRLKENPKKYFTAEENDICWIDFMTLAEEEIRI